MGQSSKRTGKGKASRALATAKRLVYGSLPEPSETVEFPWVHDRPLHGNRSVGELVHSIVISQAWREVVDPTCALWDREGRVRPDGQGKRGPKPKFDCRDYETIELLRRVGGFTTYELTLNYMELPQNRRARRLLRFQEVRQAARRGDPENFREAGVPSEGALSQHRRRIGAERRQEMWERFEQRCLELYLVGVGSESGILHLDGFNVRVPGVCPKFDRKTGELVNEELITVPDGGYQGVYSAGTKGGNGFNVVMIVDDYGVPVSRILTRIQESEKAAAIEALAQYQRDVRPHLSDEVRIISADAGFASQPVRLACRAASLIENIHDVSHGKQDRSTSLP